MDELVIKCVMCTKPVPKDRLLKKAVTCCEGCKDLYKKAKRKKNEKEECPYCRRPSTQSDRNAFLRFRTLEVQRPDLLYPKQFIAWQQKPAPGEEFPDRTPEAFRVYWQEQGTKKRGRGRPRKSESEAA